MRARGRCAYCRRVITLTLHIDYEETVCDRCCSCNDLLLREVRARRRFEVKL